MRSSLFILSAFAIGLLLSVFKVVPDSLDVGLYSKYILFLLMFLVGMNLGLDTKLLKTIRSQPLKLLLLPLATVLGTFAGAFAAVAILGCIRNGAPSVSLLDSLAVSSGFGYYSLSSIFLNEARGAEMGTIALAANIIRELMTIAFAPLMVKYFGKLAPVSSGGATSMDTTLPVIQKYSGNEYVPVSIFHGVVMDFSVPLFLTFFLSLY